MMRFMWCFLLCGMISSVTVWSLDNAKDDNSEASDDKFADSKATSKDGQDAKSNRVREDSDDDDNDDAEKDREKDSKHAHERRQRDNHPPKADQDKGPGDHGKGDDDQKAAQRSKCTIISDRVFNQAMDCIEIGTHKKPAMGDFPEKVTKEYSPKWIAPCCRAVQYDDDTDAYSSCLGLLFDLFFSEDKQTNECGMGTGCGAFGCTGGCNTEDCSGFVMPTVACVNCTCAAGPHPKTGCIGVGVSCINCGIVHADEYGPGCFVSPFRTGCSVLKKEVMCNPIKFLRGLCCGEPKQE